MKYDWILDVLTDLKTFSSANGLNVLAEELDDIKLLAAAEISNRTAQEEAQAVALKTGGRFH